MQLRHRKLNLLLCAFAFAASACVIWMSLGTEDRNEFLFTSTTLEGRRLELGRRWQSKAFSDRSDLLQPLLNVEAKRSSTYDLEGSLLEGMTIDEVQEMLGRDREVSQRDGMSILSYHIGSIEPDKLGKIMPGIAKVDHLWIYFENESERAVNARTVN